MANSSVFSDFLAFYEAFEDTNRQIMKDARKIELEMAVYAARFEKEVLKSVENLE